MKRSNRLIALATLFLCSAPALSQTQTYLAHSNYDQDLDGWRVKDTINNVSSYYAPTWLPNGGAPDGHMEFHDVTPGGYIFEAPDKFHGDFSAAVGNGGVFYDWGADWIMDDRRSSVTFWSGDVRLWASSNQGLATNVWHHFDYAFDMGVGWKVDYGLGAQTATMADLYTVLSNVTDMNISGETWTGITETTWVDNPTIYMNVPAPGALALFGLAGLVGRRRRSSRRV
ncbi:MAG: hypothetical protein P8J86_07535 [Phycisphaerales bacterium]|nr:hypothetical protein [Phycisphaerales bacterium]